MDGRVRVLLVEDEPKLAFAVQSLLEHSGRCEVVAVAPDGDAAVSLSSRLQPDVAIVDVRLADADGIEAAEQMRRVSADTRFIVYSGDDHALRRAHDAGFEETLLKGAIVDDLLRLVERL